MPSPKETRDALFKYYEDRFCSEPIAPTRSDSPSPRWHVAQIVSGTEQTVAERLKRLRFGVYFPLLRVMKTVPRKLLSARQRERGHHLIKRPLLEVFLPGYLFVHFDYDIDLWHDIFDLNGVRGLVCHGNLPKPIPDSLIEGWQGMEEQGAIPGGAKIHSLFPYRIGETVRITEGAFAGHNGTLDKLPKGYIEGTAIEELDESKRVGLLVDLFGQKTRLDLALGEFEKLQANP